MILQRLIGKLFKMRPAEPLVVVLGATGTGKSKLAVEIASKFNGEVISADSMQVYKGLDIVTNKVTESECGGIPHHMLNFLEPNLACNAFDFKSKVLPIIGEIHERKKLPVVVGGTHYYIESLLWNLSISSAAEKETKPGYGDKTSAEESKIQMETTITNKIPKLCQEDQLVPASLNNYQCESDNYGNKLNNTASNTDKEKGVVSKVDQKFVLKNINNLSDDEISEQLKLVDHESFNQIHPNDKRKLRRSLEIYYSTGLPQSVHYKKQQEIVGGRSLGGEVRFKNVALIWIQCEKDVLIQRLDARVDQMIENGLLNELEEFHKTYNAPRLKDSDDSYTSGIFQSIGFKEFHLYLLLTDDEKKSESGQALYKQGIEDMKVHTRQYAKKQLCWITNRLLIRDRNLLPVYALNGSEPSEWQYGVQCPAFVIVSSMLDGSSCSIAPETVQSSTDEIRMGDKTRYDCEVCDKVIVGKNQWIAHIQGNRHKKMKSKAKRGKLKEDGKDECVLQNG